MIYNSLCCTADELHVLQHDLTEGKDFTSAYFLSHHARNVLFCLQQNSSIQVELDYSVGFFKGDNYQVGCIGISDMSHIFWPIIFNICDGERTEHVVKMYQHMLSLIAAIVKGIKEMFFLKDGGTAIDSATSILIQNYVQSHVKFSPIRCQTHLFRGGFTRGGGIR